MRKTASMLAAAALWCEALYALFLCAEIVDKWVVGRSEFEGLHLRAFAIGLCWMAMCVWAARSAVRLSKKPSAVYRWSLLATAAVHLGLAMLLVDGYQNWLLGAGALLVVIGVQRV